MGGRPPPTPATLTELARALRRIPPEAHRQRANTCLQRLQPAHRPQTDAHDANRIRPTATAHRTRTRRTQRMHQTSRAELGERRTPQSEAELPTRHHPSHRRPLRNALRSEPHHAIDRPTLRAPLPTAPRPRPSAPNSPRTWPQSARARRSTLQRRTRPRRTQRSQQPPHPTVGRRQSPQAAHEVPTRPPARPRHPLRSTVHTTPGISAHMIPKPPPLHFVTVHAAAGPAPWHTALNPSTSKRNHGAP